MKHLINLITLAPLLLMLIACSNPPPAEDSCNFVQNAFSRRVSWARLPIQMYANKNLSDEMVEGIREAMQVWNDELGYTAFELVGNRRTQDLLPDPQVGEDGRTPADGFNMIYLVGPEYFERSQGRDEQARTSINYRGDYIYEADILLDNSEDYYFNDLRLSVNSQQTQFKSLLVHELGHVLGLGHIDIAGVNSVMSSRLQYGELRTELFDVDRESLSCEY